MRMRMRLFCLILLTAAVDDEKLMWWWCMSDDDVCSTRYPARHCKPKMPM